MGVVHKLKDEVIDFIVTSKQKEPKLSCRKLADLVKSTFDVDVSKSSVNNILKDANLSSSVGRRSKKSDDKQFKIPDQKKSQLFAEMQKLKSKKKKKSTTLQPSAKPKPRKQLSADKPLKPKKPVSPQKIKKTENVKETAETVRKESPPTTKPKIEAPRRPDEFERQRNSFYANFSEMYANLGAVVLKCIQWSISDQPVLSEILRSITEYCPISNDEIYTEAIFNGLLLADSSEYRHPGLDAVSEVNVDVIRVGELNSRREWMGAVNLSKHSNLSVVTAFQQLLTQVSGYVITYNSGDEVFIDVDFKVVRRTPPATKKTAFLHRAMANISDFLISNRQSPCFLGLNSDTDDEQTMAEYLKLFVQYNNSKIARIGLLDINGHELTDIKHIPSLKRTFSIGIWPKSSFYNKAISGLKWTGKEPMYVPEIDKIAYFSVSREYIDENIALKKIFVWTENKDAPDVIIISNDCNKITYVIRQFIVTYAAQFLRIDTHKKTNKQENLSYFSGNQSIATVEEVLSTFAKIVQIMAKDKFNISNSLQGICEKSGKFFISPHAIIIHLDVDDLEQYVQLMNNINTASFCSFSGRKILLFPSKKS